MKTTIYELLGMIKDGKAPKKIYYKNEIFEYDEKEKDYVHIDFTEYLFDSYNLFTILNDEVEILETTITYKPDKIEKINNAYYHLQQDEQNQLFKYKINEIIDRLNKE